MTIPCEIYMVRANSDLENFAKTLESVCIQVIEDGFMTKDLAISIYKNPK